MKSTFLFLIVFISSQSLWGQRFSVEISSDSVLIGNYIEVKFSTDEVNYQFESPEFKDFQIVSGPNSSMSSQYINGKYSGEKTISYYIKPIEEGQLTIEPGYFTLDDQTHETEAIEVSVFPNPEGIIQQPEQEEHNFFFKRFEFPGFNKEEVEEKPAKKKRKLKRL